MRVRSSGVMKIKELHLRELARGGEAGPLWAIDPFTLPEGLARGRICAIFVHGCRFPS
jgi:hypothetical protein